MFKRRCTGVVQLRPGPSLCNWKSTFLRPLTAWNLSFEDIKSSILATGACDTTKDPWSRKDRCFEHNEEEGETSVSPLTCLAPLVAFRVSPKPWLWHQNDSYEHNERENFLVFFVALFVFICVAEQMSFWLPAWGFCISWRLTCIYYSNTQNIQDTSRLQL